MNNSSLFFKDKPLFGLDIGGNTIKVMQLDRSDKKYTVRGYGVTKFDEKALKDGVIVDYPTLAGAVKELFKKDIVGEINTRRVVMSIPASRTFTRSISLPAMNDKDIMQAVQLEADQYIPIPVDELYMDYTVIERTADNLELLAVASPKKIVDSQMMLARMLGLEPVAFDTTILSAGRLFQRQIDIHDIPSILIDFGSISADITIHDRTVLVTGTLQGGGDELTNLIAKKLNITKDEAHIVKTKYGLSKSKKQAEIIEALKPWLETLQKEIRRMTRYYEERSGATRKLEQVITMGGGANMPGLSTYLTDSLRIPVRTCNPWQHLDTGRLQPPSAIENAMYVTVAGLALVEPEEIFS